MEGKEIILNNDNVLNINILLGKTVDYHQHKMTFFRKYVLYTFQNPIKLKRCTYNMLMEEISSQDKLMINTLLSRINKSMLINDSAFINAKDIMENTFDEGYTNQDKWIITVEIQGIKTFNDKVGPIWRIKTVKKVE